MYNICCFRHNNASPYIGNKLGKYQINLFDYKIANIHYNKPLDFKYLESFSKIILTSRNTIRDKDIENWQKINLNTEFIIIGKNFASYLKENNIKNIQIFNSVKDVSSIINAKDSYLYIRGENISYDLAFSHPHIKEILFYRLEFNEINKSDILNFFIKNNINQILFLSLEIAKFITEKISQTELQKFEIICLSNRIAKYFADFHDNILYPKEPEVDLLTNLILKK